jgi:hypothetical protein
VIYGTPVAGAGYTREQVAHTRCGDLILTKLEIFSHIVSERFQELVPTWWMQLTSHNHDLSNTILKNTMIS